MSARQSNTVARLHLLSVIAPDALRPDEKLQGWVYKQPGMPTLSDVYDAVRAVDVAFGNNEGLALLQRFGVQRTTDLWIGLYGSVVKFAGLTLAHKVPPSAPWDGDEPITYKEESL